MFAGFWHRVDDRVVKEIAIMWLIHPQLGFFSIVVPRNQKTGAQEQHRLMIRARTRAHLELLRQQHPILAKTPVLRSPDHADYRWRCICDRGDVAQAMREMIEQADWTNVKSEGVKHQGAVGADFVHALHDCHALFERLQNRQADEPGE